MERPSGRHQCRAGINLLAPANRCPDPVGWWPVGSDSAHITPLRQTPRQTAKALSANRQQGNKEKSKAGKKKVACQRRVFLKEKEGKDLSILK